MSDLFKNLDKVLETRLKESPDQLKKLNLDMRTYYLGELEKLKKDIASKASQLKEQKPLIANLQTNLQVTQTSLKQLKIVCLILAILVAASVTILLLTVH
ncbi:hypothetical protein D3C71_1391450 [compost metagenome]